MRSIKFVSHTEELQLIVKLGEQLLDAGFNASNSCIVTVSTDYSAMVGQILRHQLSFNGEVCDGFGIDVPYPDEVWNRRYVDEMYEMFRLHSILFRGKTLIFVEAAVIRGGNYTYIIDWTKKRLETGKKLITLALYENTHSTFKSDFVGEYYDNQTQDLTFWWERDNNHWK